MSAELKYSATFMSSNIYHNTCTTSMRIIQQEHEIWQTPPMAIEFFLVIT